MVPTAANPLDEPGIAEELEGELLRAQVTAERLDIDTASSDEIERALDAAGVIAVSGGDPFYLLASARRSGFEVAVRAAVSRGVVYLGLSAGAMIAGPSLEPLRLSSPFAAPDGLDLTAMGLTDVLVLPHHNAPGRALRHDAARKAYGHTIRLVPLYDHELLVIDDGVAERRP